jgi:hypothetical protein
MNHHHTFFEKKNKADRLIKQDWSAWGVLGRAFPYCFSGSTARGLGASPLEGQSNPPKQPPLKGTIRWAGPTSRTRSGWYPLCRQRDKERLNSMLEDLLMAAHHTSLQFGRWCALALLARAVSVCPSFWACLCCCPSRRSFGCLSYLAPKLVV